MKKRSTLSLALAAVAGGVLGAGALFFLLLSLGHTSESPISSPLSSARSPSVSPSSTMLTSSPSALPPATPSSATQRKTLTSSDKKYTFLVPNGYRLANRITDADASQSPTTSSITLTKGSEEQETQYLSLLAQLRGDPTGTEAPSFLPGKTIVIARTTSDEKTADAQLASSKHDFTTAERFSATRFQKVNGLFTYDATYIQFPEKGEYVVTMMYSSEIPSFDEEAYLSVLNSLRPAS